MKKMVMYIMIFVSVILSQFIFVNNVKADETINGIYISDDFYFPIETDYLCTSTDTCLKQKIESEYNGNYHVQCWYSSGPAENRSSDIYCYVGNSGFVPYLSYNYGSYINANYNPDGFSINGQPWINNTTHNSYSSYAIYKWDSVNYTWSTICNNWSNTCIYNMVFNTPFPTFFYSSISGDTMTPIFKTDIWYTSDRWNAPFIQGLDLKPRPLPQNDLFQIDFIQGPVLMANYDGRTANLLSYYVRPLAEDININDYKYCYIESSGGFRDSETCFELKYWESGEVVNGVRYYYYYNLPLFYNIEMTYNIYDLEDNLIQSDTINAYLDILPELDNYSIYNFYNYEYANMSNINSGYFAISADLIGNVDINVVNINNNTKQPFLTSSYYNSNDSYLDSNGYQWYNFNFNNDSVYLEIINKVNDITDFWAYVDNYDLKLIFDNSAYVHLSGNASSEENKDNPVNQQSYMDSNGNIHYIDNPVVSDFSDTSGFMSHIQKFFPNISNDSFGITSIVTSPLNLIKSMVSKTCSPLILPLPYTNSNITLPCMTQVYQFYYPLLYEIYELVLYGIISYHIIVDIYFTINKIRASHYMNEIEVVDL